MNIFIVIMVIAINIVIVITIIIIIVIEVILFAVIMIILFIVIFNLQEVSLAARLPIKVLKDHFFATRDCNDNCEEDEDDKYYYADYDHII